MWQVTACSATVLPVQAQPLSLAAQATATLVFDIFLTSSAAASLSCSVVVTDPQAGPGSACSPAQVVLLVLQQARYLLL